MNIAQALKEKNRILKKLAECEANIEKSNVWRTDNKDKPFVVENELARHNQLVAELVKVKAAISRASLPIHDKIAQLSLRGRYLAKLRALNTDGTPVMKGGSFSTTADTAEVNVQINSMRKQEMIQTVVDEIAALQDQIDSFNATTNV